MGATTRTTQVKFDGDAKGVDAASRKGSESMDRFSRNAGKSFSAVSKGAAALGQQVDNTTRQIEKLKAEFESTGDMRLLKSLDREERNLKRYTSQLAKFKTETDDTGNKLSFFSRIGVSAGKGLSFFATAATDAGGAAKFLANPVGATVAALGLVAGLTLAGGVALAGFGAGLIGLGALALRNSKQVNLALTSMKSTADFVGQSAAQSLEGEFVGALEILDKTARRAEPGLRRMFSNAAPAVTKLATGVDGLAMNSLPGLEDAADGAEDVLSDVAAVLPETGTAVSSFGSSLEDAADGGGQALIATLRMLNGLVIVTGKAISFAAQTTSFLSDAAKSFTGNVMGMTLDRVAREQRRAGEAAKLHSDDLVGLSASALEATIAAQELNDTLAGKTLSLAESQTRAAQGAVELAEAMKVGAMEWRNSTAEGRENQTALQGAANDAFRMRDAVMAAATAQGRGATAASEGNAALAAYAGGLRQTMRDAGLTDARIDELFRSVGLLPSSKQIAVGVPGADRAYQQLQDINAAEDRISRLVSIHARVTGSSAAMATINQLSAKARAGVEGKARGGPVASGRTYLVGERGPELLTMGNRPGNITPNHALGGGPQVIENHIHIGDEVVRVVRTEISESNRGLKRRALAGAGAMP